MKTAAREEVTKLRPDFGSLGFLNSEVRTKEFAEHTEIKKVTFKVLRVLLLFFRIANPR